MTPFLSTPGDILIVDDTPENIRVLSAALTRAGHRVRGVVNGSMALKAARSAIPDLILLDIRMPEMDGYEVCQFLKNDAITCDIPVIFLSALDDVSDKVKAFTVGGVDYVTKPFHIQEVLSRINKQLALQSAKTAIRKLNTELELRVQQRTAQLAQAKLEIEQREQLFRALIEHASDIVALTDQQGIIQYTSPATERVLGHSPQAWIGHCLLDWVHPEDRQAALDMLKTLKNSAHSVLTGELRWQTKEHTWCICETMIKPVPDNHGSAGIIINIRDITERLRAEATQRALEREQELSLMKLRFFSMASHEFRTPLSIIMMASEFLETAHSEWLNAKILRNIHRIQDQAKHLRSMLTDVLTIARMETQHVEFNPQPCCVKTLCEQWRQEAAASQPHQCSIDWTFAGEDRTVSLDTNLLRSILLNLLINALKYAGPQGQATFHALLSANSILFTITDNGIGIPEAEQANIFDAFYRGTNVGKIEGSGLGLAIVKKSVDLHGGKISCQSSIGVGTTFTVELPLVA